MKSEMSAPPHKGAITVSIVSHRHGRMVTDLVGEILRETRVERVIVTLNVEEDIDLPTDERIIVIRNPVAKGFGANHNAAFELCTSRLFAVVNPDIRILDNSLSDLAEHIEQSQAALAVPLVLSPDGHAEDSVRKFPTPISLLLKALGMSDGRLQLPEPVGIVEIPWAAGMFLLFDVRSFAQVGGFDERYFLYYEDVDICARIRQSGGRIILCGDAKVVHDAQRTSRRNLRYASWHLSSMLRFLVTHSWRLPRIPDSGAAGELDRGRR